MESHIRINITANWNALQVLSATSYKVLMALAARADCYGVCFPSVERQAFDCNLHTETIYKALDTLLTDGYIKVLRKPHYDPLKRKNTPTVYQVSPVFLEIAEQFKERANRLWNNLSDDATTEKPYINQQQNYVPEQSTKEPPPETTTTTAALKKTASREPQNKSSEQQRELQRSENRKNSAIVKNYTNPNFVQHALPDALSERLADTISTLEIKIPIARGFVVEYGYDACQAAYKHLQISLETQEITNRAGFFRYVLQCNIGEMLPSLKQKSSPDYTGGEYQDFVEH